VRLALVMLLYFLLLVHQIGEPRRAASRRAARLLTPSLMGLGAGTVPSSRTASLPTSLSPSDIIT
jgi:hypothetical protein